MINDGVALTIFATAVASVGVRTSMGEVATHLAVEVLGGVGFGLFVGVLVLALRKRVRDATGNVLLSLVTPYAAFVPAQLVESSGVLATVSAAVWLSLRGRGLVEPTVRLQTETFWRVLDALLQGVLFVLLGVQVPAIAAAVAAYPWPLLGAGAAVTAAAIGARLLWVMGVAPAVQRLPLHDRVSAPVPWQERAALAWCGPRGAASLAGSDVTGLRLRLIEVERATLRELHRRRDISRATMLAISQEFDAEETTVRGRGLPEG